MHKRAQLGHWGESVAVRYLRRKGFVLLQRNVYTRFGEIDLVMLDGKELVFVEVKTRRSNRFGTGAEAITHNKLLRLERSIDTYLSTWSFPVSYRLDVLAIAKEQNTVVIEYIRNASLGEM